MMNVCETAHTPGQPAQGDYFAWYAFAEHMSKTHRNVRCPGCGLFKVWVKKQSLVRTQPRATRAAVARILRTLAPVLLALLIAVPASAQIPVTDLANLSQLIKVVGSAVKQLATLTEQWALMTRMSQGLRNMEQYRTVPIAGSTHDVSRFPYGAVLLQALNAGDARGDLYRQVIAALPPLPAAVDQLPPDARARIRRAAAIIDVADSVLERGIHNTAQNRGFSAVELARTIAKLMDDILNPRTAYHHITARLDMLTGGELIARRQDTATNQVIAHSLEQLLVKSARARETEAETMELRLSALQAPPTLVKDDAQALRTWRMP